MAWESRGKYGQRDEDLFADPFGVRQGSQRSQGSAAPQGSSNTFGGGKGRGSAPLERDEFLFGGKGQGYAARSDDMYGGMQGHAYGGGELDPQVQDEEEEWRSWGPVGSFFWYVYSGGKKCCSMRDRSKPQDMDAAQRAAETGRPPQSFFPEPPGQGYPGGGRLGGSLEESERPQTSAADRALQLGGFGSSQRPPMQLPSQPAASPAKPQYQRPSETDSEASDFLSSRRGQNERPDVSSFSGWKQAQPDAPKAQLAGGDADSKRGLPVGGDTPGSDVGGSARAGAISSSAGRSPGSDASGVARPGASSSAAPPGPKRWEWPSWCLNFKSPSIEVFVVDDETGVGRWVEAEPQSRVVDTAGRGAYPCAE
mmetsp:Transcript_2645/g.5275  ORF Transcript_2645/g.5275 Transcript_2645/m.5275 type:complete len:368 (-) Transcript_2645:26-1129(-)